MTMIKPYPFQAKAVKRFHELDGRVLLASEMGLGKSAQVLWWMKQADAFPSIIICPASLKYMWEAEVDKILNYRVSVLETQKPPKGGQKEAGDIVVINYDILQHWLPWLRLYRAKTIVMDEAHVLANRTTKRTKAAKDLCRRADHVMALTGTPIQNRPAELWQILNLIRPDLYPAFFPYAQAFCAPRRKPWGWEYKGATNLPMLHQQLSQLMVRDTKAKVLKELPKKQRSVVPLPLRRPREYERATKHFLAWIAEKGKGKLEAAKKAEKIVKMGEMKRLAAKLKLKSVVEWIEDFFTETDGQEKLVVMAIHKKMIQALKRRITQPSVVIDGSTSKRDRKLAVDKFQNDPNTKVFIGNIQAAGVGLTLTRASTLVFTELDWRPAMHSQAEARIHRIGQTQTAQIYYLIAKNTIEERLASVIQEKQRTFNQVIDGGMEEDDLDVFDMLLDSLESK